MHSFHGMRNSVRQGKNAPLGETHCGAYANCKRGQHLDLELKTAKDRIESRHRQNWSSSERYDLNLQNSSKKFSEK